MRRHRAAHPGAETERYRADPAYAEKVRARKRVSMRRYRQRSAKRPCENCGEPVTQAHHDDYTKPLEVRALCRKCHGAQHYPEAQPKAQKS